MIDKQSNMTPAARRTPALRSRCSAPRRRHGWSVLELLLVLPVVIAMALGVVQVFLLLSANNQVKLATELACRVGTLQSRNADEMEAEVRRAAVRGLMQERLIRAHDLTFYPGSFTGDPVVVEIKMPMTAAAPNLLGLFGVELKKRYLYCRTEMRKE